MLLYFYMPHQGERMSGPPRIDTRGYQPNKPRSAEQAELTSRQLAEKNKFLKQWGVSSVEEAAVQAEIAARGDVKRIQEQIQNQPQNSWSEQPDLPFQPTKRTKQYGPRPQLSGDQIGKMARIQGMEKKNFGEKVADFFRNVFG